MAHHEGELRLKVAHHVVQVAVADAGGLDPDTDLSGPGLIQFDVFEL
jgi:hypothetical protein